MNGLLFNGSKKMEEVSLELRATSIFSVHISSAADYILCILLEQIHVSECCAFYIIINLLAHRIGRMGLLYYRGNGFNSGIKMFFFKAVHA